MTLLNMSDGPTRTSPMTSAELEKSMENLTRERGDRRVCVFVPGIGDLEIRGVTTNGQISTFAPDAQAARVEKLERLLKLVQSDPGNWLHSDLQTAIVEAVGEDPPYRSIDDSGVDASTKP